MIFKELKIPAAGRGFRDCLITKWGEGKEFEFEYNKDSDETNWRIKFGEILSYKVISEEFSLFGYMENLPNGSEYYFYEIEDSPWLSQFRTESNEDIIDKFKHYVFCTYDELIEVLTDRFEVEKLENPNS